MKEWSDKWKASKMPEKQRKYVYRAPLHVRNKLLCSHLSPVLRKKYGRRSLRVVKGDTVKIMVGGFKGKTGKVESIDAKNAKIYITGIEVVKKDGSKVLYPVKASNLMLQEINTSDKKRIKRSK